MGFRGIGVDEWQVDYSAGWKLKKIERGGGGSVNLGLGRLFGRQLYEQ